MLCKPFVKKILAYLNDRDTDQGFGTYKYDRRIIHLPNGEMPTQVLLHLSVWGGGLRVVVGGYDVQEAFSWIEMFRLYRAYNKKIQRIIDEAEASRKAKIASLIA